ncbi:hypothetical protein SNEBB_008347 [Seison nebaliae]|nr:hypothetical protein SNEBB_008347 [Seison nebaliae]
MESMKERCRRLESRLLDLVDAYKNVCSERDGYLSELRQLKNTQMISLLTNRSDDGGTLGDDNHYETLIEEKRTLLSLMSDLEEENTQLKNNNDKMIRRLDEIRKEINLQHDVKTDEDSCLFKKNMDVKKTEINHTLDRLTRKNYLLQRSNELRCEELRHSNLFNSDDEIQSSYLKELIFKLLTERSFTIRQPLLKTLKLMFNYNESEFTEMIRYIS